MRPDRPHPTRRPPTPRQIVGGTLVVLALAALVRVIGITREPWGDELYHILSARQFLESGTMGINGGVYDRVPLFTRLVAWSMHAFGDGVVAGRLPALVAGVLLPAAVFAWARLRGPALAAWVAGVLVALDPTLRGLSQYSRFYTMQLLAFFVGVALVYEAVRPGQGRGRRAALAVAAAAALLFATSLQVVTLIGAAGAGLYVLLVLVPPALARLPMSRRAWVAGGGTVLGLVLLALVATSPIGRILAGYAEYTDLWGLQNADPRFYHWFFQSAYPTLWSLLPLLVAAGFAAHRRLTLLSLCVFGLAFVVHTLMTWKTPRYLSYSFPFFFLLCGLGVAAVVPLLRRLLERAANGVPALALRPGLRRAALAITGGAATAFMLFTNPAFPETARDLLRDPSMLYPGGSTPTLSWRLASATLRPLVDSVDAVVTTEDLEAFYFLGRANYVLDKDHLFQGGRKPEFTVDPRIRTPMVSERSSLERIVACNATGLVVGMRWALNARYKMPAETAEFIEHHLTPVTLPRRTGLVAYRWHTPHVDAAACAAVPTPAAPARAIGIAGRR